MKKRLAFIDLLRGWSLIVMIEVHVFNSMLRPELKLTGWFSNLNFLNGLVAPAFLFISGFSFYIASQRKMEEFRKFKYQFWRQIGRISMIWVIGYLLRLPYFSLTRTIQKSNPEQLILFYSVDILQCIAVGLLLLFILRILIVNDKSFVITLFILALTFILASPLVWNADIASFLPVPVANYFNRQNGSLFPLFPWLGFMLMGAVYSSYYLKSSPDKEQSFLRNTLVTGLVLIAAAIIALYLSIPFFEPIEKIRPNTFFFGLRLGLILLMLVFFRYYELKRKTEKSFVLTTGRESLLVYWLHLQIIYRQFSGSISLDSIIGQSFGIIECIAATIVLVILMAFTAKLWGMFKMKYPKYSPIIVGGTMAVILLVFLIS